MKNKSLLSDPKALKALAFAANAHAGQYRKYTGEPYITHPMAVAALVSEVPCNSVTVIEASYLHDVVEDCDVSLGEIGDEFGPLVEVMVRYLSINKDKTIPRRERKATYRQSLKFSPGPVQTIKMADMLHNAPGIIAHDPVFAEVWLPEARAMYSVLRGADPSLRERLDGLLRQRGY